LVSHTPQQRLFDDASRDTQVKSFVSMCMFEMLAVPPDGASTDVFTRRSFLENEMVHPARLGEIGVSVSDFTSAAQRTGIVI
jgi:hypothetical protein